jgi:hypothetical protein
MFFPLFSIKHAEYYAKKQIIAMGNLAPNSAMDFHGASRALTFIVSKRLRRD